MPNSFYEYDDSLLPGALAKAEDVGYQYNAIAAGFELIEALLNRSIRFTPLFLGNAEIPDSLDYTNQLLYLDESGNMALYNKDDFDAAVASAIQAALDAAGYADSAATAATNAATSETNAAASEAKSQQWATEAEDVLIDGTGYSAYHWAQKAILYATGLIDVTEIATDTYNVSAADVGDMLRFTSANPITITVPDLNALPNGSLVHYRQAAAGQITLAPGVGVTINTSDTLKSRATGSTLSMIKVGTNEWDLVGDMEAI